MASPRVDPRRFSLLAGGLSPLVKDIVRVSPSLSELYTDALDKTLFENCLDEGRSTSSHPALPEDHLLAAATRALFRWSAGDFRRRESTIEDIAEAGLHLPRQLWWSQLRGFSDQAAYDQIAAQVAEELEIDPLFLIRVVEF